MGLSLRAGDRGDTNWNCQVSQAPRRAWCPNLLACVAQHICPVWSRKTGSEVSDCFAVDGKYPAWHDIYYTTVTLWTAKNAIDTSPPSWLSVPILPPLLTLFNLCRADRNSQFVCRSCGPRRSNGKRFSLNERAFLRKFDVPVLPLECC